MIYIVSGITLIVVSGGSFLCLLPRNGQVHRLVRNSDVGSAVTIFILSGFTFGVVLLFGAFFD
jgi:hypothetical protein